MKKLTLLAAGMLISVSVSAADLSLEPCINGNVSFSGTHMSQEYEDRSMAVQPREESAY
ncbi:MAG: hypothetical protein N0E37_08340 [Candidatus Thiodiazotropha taylori]|nr:hypothetical protein [Candidatus Thiodiazotropha taylori]MCG7964938.1 hypothetical protein [Candidatus Thiodiazotropha endolucinida]MCG7894822.1 hypothetical protein [Candidatus Thiodiazotropha taylori]MCG7905054.1 hypothetical protein [Candidatus Thiodiazotropha taylori]MCG7917752.1 hypothetical protein [Candidatus Thiodiazotropha taylori]